MTRIITRVFADVADAERAVYRMNMKGVPKRNREIILKGNNAKAEMERAGVHESALSSYSDYLAKGHAVVVVRATYKPLGVARIVREIFDKLDAVQTGSKVVNDHPVAWEPDKSPSVLKDHPRFLTFPGMEMTGHITDSFGFPMLKTRKPKRNLMSGGKRMSRMFWPMPLISKKKRSSSVMRGGRQMSKSFWPAKLISSKPRRKSVIPSGGYPF
jgi:hypothetical protein